jgi:hypothetical protein
MNAYTNFSNITLQADQILSNQGHRYIVNHVMINNLASIHFDYQINHHDLVKIGFSLKSKL